MGYLCMALCSHHLSPRPFPIKEGSPENVVRHPCIRLREVLHERTAVIHPGLTALAVQFSYARSSQMVRRLSLPSQQHGSNCSRCPFGEIAKLLSLCVGNDQTLELCQQLPPAFPKYALVVIPAKQDGLTVYVAPCAAQCTAAVPITQAMLSSPDVVALLVEEPSQHHACSIPLFTGNGRYFHKECKLLLPSDRFSQACATLNEVSRLHLCPGFT